MIKLVVLLFFLVVITLTKATIYCASCDRGVTVSTCECGNRGSPIPSQQGWCCNTGNAVSSGILSVLITAISVYLWTKIN